MNRSQLEKQMNAINQMNPAKSGTGVSQFIRTAERYMAGGKYTMALEQLSYAQELEPQNQYIEAIMERVRNLQKDNPAPAPVTANGNRYLSVTVGKEFQNGIRSDVDEPDSSPLELKSRVRELTDTAEILLNRGLNESAFDALMKAYLLDPLSPDVLSCEKRVLPAWEVTRKQKALGLARPVMARSPVFADRPSQKISPTTPNDSQRINLLKGQKESERIDRERALWREASRLPKALDKDITSPPDLPVDTGIPAEKEEKGLFARFKKKRPLL